MTLGLVERQGELFNVAVQHCKADLPERSINRLLHAEWDRLFGDELFADMYVHHRRRSIPPSILAVVLQRLGAARTGGPSIGSPMTCAGGMPPAWMTRWGRSRIPCWWSCVLRRSGSGLPGDDRAGPGGWAGGGAAGAGLRVAS
jgi:hypothetical protein